MRLRGALGEAVLQQQWRSYWADLRRRYPLAFAPIEGYERPGQNADVEPRQINGITSQLHSAGGGGAGGFAITTEYYPTPIGRGLPMQPAPPPPKRIPGPAVSEDGKTFAQQSKMLWTLDQEDG